MPNLRLCFKISTLTALVGWLVLIGLPFWAWTDELILFVVVMLLALIYGYVLQAALRQKSPPGEDRPGFFSLRGVLALFRNPSAALAGWVHILAFDLMVGLYIRHEGALLGMSHWALLPCYLLTLMFGPLGLLLFFALRWLSL